MCLQDVHSLLPLVCEGARLTSRRRRAAVQPRLCLIKWRSLGWPQVGEFGWPPGGGTLAKKMAGYHQFHAVRVAVEETLRAAPGLRDPSAGRYETRKPGGEGGDRRIGVVWHTQGSGKSLTMAFYAGRIIREQAVANPTIGGLTDRKDLEDQLFGT